MVCPCKCTLPQHEYCRQADAHTLVNHAWNDLVYKPTWGSISETGDVDEQSSLVNQDYCDQYLMLHNVTVNIDQYQSVKCMHVIYYCTAVIASKSF